MYRRVELMYSYSAYGMSLHSVLPLPELTPSEDGADVEIRLGHLGEAPLSSKSGECVGWIDDTGVFLCWKDVATFFIRDGREILIDISPGAEEKRVRLLLLGAALSIVLHQRGYLVFHASAMAINNAGVMFIGNKGWGKSTMAAAMHKRGHLCMADDVVAIDDSLGSIHMVLPSFPQLKLWPDAISSLGGNPDTFPLVVSLAEKRDNRILEGYLSKSVPLKCIYVLGVSNESEPEIKPLTSQEALMYMVANTYNARFGELIFLADRASHLFRSTRLVKSIPIYHLMRPRSLEMLPIVSELVEKHILESVIQ